MKIAHLFGGRIVAKDFSWLDRVGRTKATYVSNQRHTTSPANSVRVAHAAVPYKRLHT